MKKIFGTPEGRRAAVEGINQFQEGKITTDELAMRAGHFKMLYFEKGHNGNFNCFMVLSPDGFSKEHPDIPKYQNIPESDTPEGSILFV